MNWASTYSFPRSLQYLLELHAAICIIKYFGETIISVIVISADHADNSELRKALGGQTTVLEALSEMMPGSCVHVLLLGADQSLCLETSGMKQHSVCTSGENTGHGRVAHTGEAPQ